MANDIRGSLKLIQDHCRRSKLSEADIQNFVGAFEMEGVAVDDIFCVGTPAPEYIGGRFSVNREVLDKVVNRILDLEELRPRKWDILVNGIPHIDEAIVNVEVGRGL